MFDKAPRDATNQSETHILPKLGMIEIARHSDATAMQSILFGKAETTVTMTTGRFGQPRHNLVLKNYP
jgi:hypothetical protein